MYFRKNIGRRIQIITNILFAINIIAVVIAVVLIITLLDSTQLYNYLNKIIDNKTTVQIICIAVIDAMALIEILVAFIIKTLFEGFGRLVENSEDIREKLNDIRKEY